MTIRTRPAPATGLAALNQALGHLYARPNHALSAKGGAVDAAKPMELFTVQLTDIYDNRFLMRAIPNGWRYLIIADETSMADVRGTQPTFANLTRGDIPERLERAAHLAENKYGSSLAQFEARVLEIPALYVISLWLHAVNEQRDTFFWVADASRMESLVVSEDAGFLDEIVQRAKAAQRFIKP